MTTKITPTVGRVVHFWGSKVKFDRQEQPCAAIIAHVHGNGESVNVGYFDVNGSAASATSVMFVQEGETPPDEAPFCTWMPYQLGQAAKTEQLQQAVEAKAAADSKTEEAPARGGAGKTARGRSSNT